MTSNYFCQTCGSKEGTLSDVCGCQYSFCSPQCHQEFGQGLTALDAGTSHSVTIGIAPIKSYTSHCRHCGHSFAATRVAPQAFVCPKCSGRNT